ncbi:MAG: tRNA (N6-threonylcarbamoyladenosine(37)-N6)-methyltransferase TrmO [Pseudobdellovibrionaceae bacterium]
MEIKPIAFFKTRKKQSYEAARQGSCDTSDEIGELHFLSQQQFDQALEGIEGFSHLWLIYQFHQNTNWKPKVLPPRGSDKKVGVFATRSPYRPNGLGLSCVELVERSGLILKVKNFDLLDETPIFDVKPYLSYADSFPSARMGWLEAIEKQKFEVKFSDAAKEQLEFLKSQGLLELENFLVQQLSFEPLNSKKKRVQILSDQEAVLAYRTWRAQFQIQETQIEIQNLFSGYSQQDLNQLEDTYQDKALHRLFQSQFFIE